MVTIQMVEDLQTSLASARAALAGGTNDDEHDTLVGLADGVAVLLAAIHSATDEPHERYALPDMLHIGWLVLYWSGIPCEDALLHEFIEAVGNSTVPDACRDVASAIKRDAKTCRFCGNEHDTVPEDLCEWARGEYDRADELGAALGLDEAS